MDSRSAVAQATRTGFVKTDSFPDQELKIYNDQITLNKLSKHLLVIHLHNMQMMYCLTVGKLRVQLLMATQKTRDNLLSHSNVVTICDHVFKQGNKNICVEKLQKIRLFAIRHCYFIQPNLKQAPEVKGVPLCHKDKTYISETVTHPILKASGYYHICLLCLILKVLNSNMYVHIG